VTSYFLLVDLLNEYPPVLSNEKLSLDYWLSWKVLGRDRSWTILRYYLGIFLEYQSRQCP